MRKFVITISALFLLLIIYIAYSYQILDFADKSSNVSKSTIEDSVDYSVKDQVQIKITAVGDILIHQAQLDSQYNKAAKLYDFTNNFKYVKPYIKSSDIAIANLETTLSNDTSSYKGYPTFVSPGAVVSALKDAGFNLLTVAHNHIMDGGVKGFFDTQEIIKEKGMEYIGVKENTSDKSYVIKEIKEIKVGITNYTFETQKKGNFKTINSIKIDKNIENLMDSFNKESLQADLAKMSSRVKEMQASGAEVIVFCMHWGEEYERKPNNIQKEIAKKLSDMGVDIIFASHPHVLQPIEFIKSQKTNKETLVVYSMGNFISNQRKEILKQPYSEDGIIVNIMVKKDLKNNKITLGELSYVPTWVNKYKKGDNFAYEIVPLSDGLKNNEKYNLVSKEAIQSAAASEKNTLEVIESSSSKLVITPELGD